MEEGEVIGSHQQALYVINGLFTIILIIGWYFIKGVISNQKEADTKIVALDKALGINNANDTNHKEQFKKFEEWMLRIEKKIDGLKK